MVNEEMPASGNWLEARGRGWVLVVGEVGCMLSHPPTGYWEVLAVDDCLVECALARAIEVEQTWLQLSLWPSEIPPFVFRG